MDIGGDGGPDQHVAPSNQAPISVAALVVIVEPSPELASTLIALNRQDVPMAILVVDDASLIDPTAIVAGATPDAFVTRLQRSVGWAGAANAGAELIQGAEWLLVCHDDVAPAPDAVRSMISVAREHNADLVTPKFVAWADHERLRSVGFSSDRSAKAIMRVDSNELDQGQHDFVQAVTAVHGACMLIRAEAFRKVKGFDATMTAPPSAMSRVGKKRRAKGLSEEQQLRLTRSTTGPELGEDLDLCWRIIRSGGIAVVDPNARVAHAERRHRLLDNRLSDSGSDVTNTVGPSELEAPIAALRTLVGRRNRIRSVFSTLSGAALVRGLFGLFVQRLALTRSSLPLPAVRHLVKGSGIASLQARRSEVDRKGRSLLESQLVASDVTLRKLIRNEFAKDSAQALSIAGETVSVGWRRGPIRLISGLLLLVALSFVIGSRKIFGGVPAHGQFVEVPSVRILLRAYGSAFRDLGEVVQGPSAPGLLVAAATRVLGRIVGLGTNLFVGFITTTAMIPIGIAGAARLGAALARSSRGVAENSTPDLSRDRGLGVLSAAVAGALYGATPGAINALRTGSWEALLLFAALPWLLTTVLQVSGELSTRSGRQQVAGPRHEVNDRDFAGASFRVALRIGLPLAIVGSVAPVVLTIIVAVVVALWLGSLIAGSQEAASPSDLKAQGATPSRSVLAGALGLIVCALLFTGWLGELVRTPSLLLGRGPVNPHVTVLDVFRVASGSNVDSRFGVGGWLTLGLPIAASFTLLLVNEKRLWWAVRFWVLSLVFGAAMWAVDRGPFIGRLPSHEVLAIPVALGFVMIVAIGISGVAQDIRRAQFGWRQSVTLAAVAAVVVSVLPVLWSARSGDWKARPSDARQAAQWLTDNATELPTSSAVLWISDAKQQDGEPHQFSLSSGTMVSQRAYWSLSSLSGPGLQRYWSGSPEGINVAVAQQLRKVANRSTFRVGEALAQASVSYVVVSSAPETKNRDVRQLVEGIDQQLDLREVQRTGSVRILENVAPSLRLVQGPPGRPGSLGKSQSYKWALARWLQLLFWTAAAIGFLLDWTARRRHLDDLAEDITTRDINARKLDGFADEENETAWEESLTVQGAFRSDDDLYAEVFDDAAARASSRARLNRSGHPAEGVVETHSSDGTNVSVDVSVDLSGGESLADQMWNEWSDRRSQADAKAEKNS
jgi:GT2 family glycosyltransferase/NADH:ubiquinone oxidoreductase subunit 6 (subunit J)